MRRVALLLAFVSLTGCATSGGRLATGERSSQTGIASYYSPEGYGGRTASGRRARDSERIAAHKTLPFGSRVRVTNLANGRALVVTIVDRGPFVRGRIIDVSRGAAQELGFLREGTTKVRLELLPG